MSKITTQEQYEKLASIMATMKDIACGYQKRPKEEVQAFWEEAAETLNALGPPRKEPTAWKKVWIDWKCYVKKKLTSNKKEMVATGGGHCRIQRITPLEEKVIELTGLQTSTSGISGTLDYGVASVVEEDEGASGMDISMRSEGAGPLATTSRKRQQQSPKKTTFSLLQDQVDNQREFHERCLEWHETIADKCDGLTTQLRRINRAMEKNNEIAAMQLEEERRHNKIKEELLRKKIEIKMEMLKLEHPTIYE